jgi:hypothetical protein
MELLEPKIYSEVKEMNEPIKNNTYYLNNTIGYYPFIFEIRHKSLVWCQKERQKNGIAALRFFHGCRKRRLKV